MYNFHGSLKSSSIDIIMFSFSNLCLKDHDITKWPYLLTRETFEIVGKYQWTFLIMIWPYSSLLTCKPLNSCPAQNFTWMIRKFCYLNDHAWWIHNPCRLLKYLLQMHIIAGFSSRLLIIVCQVNDIFSLYCYSHPESNFLHLCLSANED